MKKILKNNVIKFLIGLILLSFCYVYIQKYPAEKVAIFSGFEVMVQRAEIIINKFLNRDPEALKTKFDYQTAYEELIRIAEANGCNDKSLLQELKDTSAALENESLKSLWDVLPGYIRKANEFKTRVSQQCKNAVRN